MEHVIPRLADFDWWGLVLIPLAIFCARICDVSIGTLRIVFIGRGMALPAAITGFFESLIWLLAVSQIIRHLTIPLYYIAYAAGFGTGNFVGLLIERRLAMGMVILRLMLPEPVDELLHQLRQAGYGATVIAAHGLHGPVRIVHTVLPRRSLPEVLAMARTYHPNAFYTVEAVAQMDQSLQRATRSRRGLWFSRQRK